MRFFLFLAELMRPPERRGAPQGRRQAEPEQGRGQAAEGASPGAIAPPQGGNGTKGRALARSKRGAPRRADGGVSGAVKAE